MNSQLPAAPEGRELVNIPGLPAIAGREPRFEVVQYEPLIDTRSLLRTIYRNRFLILGVLGICLLAGVLSVVLSPRIYSATAKIEIGDEADNIVAPDTTKTQAPQEADRALQTQVDLLGTRDMAQAVLGRLAVEGPKQERIAKQFAPEDLQDGLSVLLPRSTRIISISFDNQSPQIAALMANNYAEALIESNMQTRFNMSSYARQFLQKQLEVAKMRLEGSERALIAYARAAGLLDVSQGTDVPQQAIRSLTTSNLVQLNSAYAQAQSSRIQAQQRWQQAEATPLMSLPEVLTNGSIQQLTQQRAQLQAKLEEDRQRYKDEHPIVRQESANIAEMDRQIGTIASSIKASIRDQYMTAARQESALAGDVSSLKGQTLSEQDRSVRYNSLKREADTNLQLYDGLLQRYKEVSAEAGSTNNNISVVDRAVPPRTPVSPNATKNLSLATAGGAILAFLLVFVRERFDSRVADPELVDRDVAVRLLAVMPKVKGAAEPSDVILDSNSPLSEANHSLRTAIELGGDGLSPTSILFTSSKAQEGKSTTSLGLARAFAEAGQRVLLIDGDLRRPSLHRLLRVENSLGFANLLSGHAKLDQLVRHMDAFGVDLLTAGRLRGNPAAFLNSEKMTAILMNAGKVYDRIIIDGPPAVGIADATRLAAAVDATILVVKSEGVTKEEAKFALRRLESEQSNIIGAVLTMFDAHKFGSNYEYQYACSYPVPATA
jgi:polysaccharide biosynthesis transport protein